MLLMTAEPRPASGTPSPTASVRKRKLAQALKANISRRKQAAKPSSSMSEVKQEKPDDVAQG
jgi:hypothetical protein